MLAAAVAEAAPGHAAADDSVVSSPLRRETEVPQMLSNLKIASLSIAELEGGQIVRARAWGLAAPGRSATTDTLYNVASLTKPVSAEIAMRLAATGQISLDEDMSIYWVDPDLANDPRVSKLTPRLVLSHRSGLPNWRRDDNGTLSFTREPGEAFGYSGEGFEWLARFIERKTDTTFETLAQGLVFDPSGMHDTAYTRRVWFEGRLAIPYDAELNALEPQIADHYFASDDLVSTPTDYARFMAGLLQRQGVTPQLYQERQSLQTDRRDAACPRDDGVGCVEEEGFGLGWETYLIGGHRFLMHTGMDDGTFTFAYLEPATGAGLVMFTNSSNGWKAVLPILELTGADPAFIAHLRRMIS